MYFNCLNNILTKNISIYIKILCIFDILKITLIYFRYFVMGLFIKKLIHLKEDDIMIIIPFLIFIGIPYIYFIFVQALRYEYLRKIYWKLVLGMILNKICTPFLTLIIDTNMFLRLGDFRWSGVTRATPTPTPNPFNVVVFL